MAIYNLIETEKAYNAQVNNVFILAVRKAVSTVNKLVLISNLRKLGLEVLKVNTVNLPAKIKRRGKRFNMIQKKRPQKFYVTLKKDQKIDEEILTKLNALN